METDAQKQAQRGRPRKETVKQGLGVSMPPALLGRLRSEVSAGRWRSVSAALCEITAAYFQQEDTAKSSK